MVLLNTFGGPNTVIAVSVLFAGGAAIWFSLGGVKSGRIASVLAGLFLTLLIAGNIKYHCRRSAVCKGPEDRAGALHKMEQHVPHRSRAGTRASERIYIDADASTDIAGFDFNHLSAADRQVLLHQGPGIPYNLRPGAKTLVIGPGGGWDVARALASGSHDVTGVEINPIIATTIMRKKFPGLSRGLYLRPDVHIFVEDARSFVRRTESRFQVIQATLVDTWASTAAGAFALSENNLYTTEAFRDYFLHLTDDGLLTFTRWGFDPPRESLRLVSLAIAALHDLGQNDASRHVLAGREGGKSDLEGWGARDTITISRNALSDADIAHARQAFQAANMTPLYLPGDAPGNEFGKLLLSADPRNYERNYPSISLR